ncbi:chlorophyll A-B-binding protein [Tumidithrix elongata RA019]|uniref:Chlorophyll A-B-binding protein n=1 Tax=Tumidithrix elongata BACA0141 TaxID=2716417 RepID=A0AAW9Q1H8_9CYAN|nr:chlorophyll A-B-binding protein [Tumidithrix elongata RA019]
MTQRTVIKDDRGLLNNFAYEPPVYIDEESRFGFTEFAEKWNGRFAMIGFVLLLAIEYGTDQGFISLLTSAN